MHSVVDPQLKLRSTSPALVSISLVTGFAIGAALTAAGSGGPSPVVTLLEPLGTLWVNAIRMTVIPLVVPLLIVGVADSSDLRRVGTLGIKCLAWFWGMLATCATTVALIGPTLLNRITIDPVRLAALQASVHLTMPNPEDLTLRSWILSLVPTNPVKAAADGALLPLIVFTLAYAFALGSASPAVREAQVQFFRGISEVMTTLVKAILSIAPIGVFFLALSLGGRLGVNAAGAIGYYIMVIIVLHLIFTILLYVLAVVGTGVPLRQFARAIASAQAVAFSSRSSLASLPAMVQAARELKLGPEIGGFVLPLAAASFKLTSGIYWTMGAIFVARLYGVHLEPVQIATLAAASVVMNISSPGIPSGGLFIQAPLYSSVGIPVEGIGIMIAIDPIQDTFKTLMNVTADMTIAVFLDRERPWRVQPAAANA